jgi:hypothetical protein
MKKQTCETDQGDQSILSQMWLSIRQSKLGQGLLGQVKGIQLKSLQDASIEKD